MSASSLPHKLGLRRLRWPALSFDRLVVGIMLLSLLAMAARVSVDSDTWWHLRAGAWMVAERRVATQDPFTHTFFGKAWANSAWMSQIILYLLFHNFSYGGLNLFTALCVTAAFAFVYATTAGHVFVRVGAVLFGAVVASVFWAARPHIVSLLLAGVFLYLLDQFRRQGRNRLWLLPPLMALWANLHPGYAIGFILLGLTTLGEGLRALAGQQTWRSIGILVVVGIACVVALLVSPFGPELILFPFKTVSIGLLRDRIDEWQSPNFHLLMAQPFAWLVLALLAVLALSRRRANITNLLLVLATAYMGLLAGRNIALFGLVAPPLLADHVQGLIDEIRVRFGARRPARPSAPPAVAAALNWVILLAVAAAVMVKVAYVSSPDLNTSLATRGMPVAAADYLAHEHLAGPLYNPYEWGGYLAWRLYPDYPIFVDGRTDLYTDAFFADYLDLAAGAPDWAALLARYGVRLVITQRDSPLAERVGADPGWTRQYGDDETVIYSLNP